MHNQLLSLRIERIIFFKQFVINEINKVSSYNITECCVKANLSQECLPLCSYDASVTDIGILANTCVGDFHKLLRCGAGGRDHTNCCDRRGVVSECSSLCSGVADRSVLDIAAYCTSFIGNIVLCFEEGILDKIAIFSTKTIEFRNRFTSWTR